MNKIEAPGNKVKDRVFLDDKEGFRHDLTAIPDGPVLFTVERFTGRKTRPQQGYYWSTLVLHTLYILRDKCGYSEYQTKEDAHEFLKYAFNPV